jgi:hypothetical protein
MYEKFMNVEDYFVVMVNDNHYICFVYLCMLRLECKPSHANQFKMPNNLLNST